MTSLEHLRRGPVLLRADNFVPFTRTPWGGDVIGRQFKAEVASQSVGAKIGEVWEFACDPAFPSRLVEGGETLAQVVAAFPDAVCSAARVKAGHCDIEILVKLLDAAEPLSLQVHPANDDPELAEHESGKAESWLVLQAAPGAGLYLGFAAPLTRDRLREALLDGDRAKSLLHFEPVKAGDYFEIEPGVPHAIGRGVTLLEPQRVLAGKSGKTFRMWDWGRRYALDGRPDPEGQSRELHVEQSLRLVDPERQVGSAFAASLRRLAVVTERRGFKARVFPANSYYQTAVIDLAKGQSIKLSIEDGYGALLMLTGVAKSGDIMLAAGQPALLPHLAMPMTFQAESDCSFAVVTPATSQLSF